MENTLENKAKFYSQYYGQYLLVCGDSHEKYTVKNFTETSLKEDYLKLTPLSMISDEDAIEVAKMCALPLDETYKPFFDVLLNEKEFCNYLFMARPMSIYEAENIISFLRSKGYALSFMGLSVEQQIEYGWIKLKK